MLFFTTLKSLEYGLVDIHIFRFPMFLRFLGFFSKCLNPAPPPNQKRRSEMPWKTWAWLVLTFYASSRSQQ